MVIVHLIFLHEFGSNNPLGIDSTVDQVPFTPYALYKDLFSLVLFFMFFGLFVYFMPNALGHPDNYIPANPMVTPPHIVPEWYFLPFYAILRSIPDKLGGVLAMFGAILILLIIPFYIKSDLRSAAFRPIYRTLFWVFFFNCLILGWIGGNEVKFPFYEVGQLSTIFYFAYFLFLIPLTNRLERFFWNKKFNHEFKKSNPYPEWEDRLEELGRAKPPRPEFAPANFVLLKRYPRLRRFLENVYNVLRPWW